MTSLEAAERTASPRERERERDAAEVAPPEEGSFRGRGPEGQTWEAPTFDEVYREHFRFAWRIARRLGVEPAFLEDVVQEAFVVVHRRLGDFAGRSALKSWLYGIVRRVVADHRRSLRRKPTAATAAHVSGLDEMQDPRDPGARTPDGCVEQAEQVKLLRRLLDALDEEKREVFVLAELEEMTVAQIAEALGANANTIASRLRAARRAFEEALEAATGDPSGSAIERRPR
jgi:RNA polymerase sigma-70 factor (ECF subfamily)